MEAPPRSPSSPPSSPSGSPSVPSFALYPEGAWFTLVVFLVVVGLFQWGSVLHSKIARLRQQRRGMDVESTRSSSHPRVVRTGWSPAHLPLAAVNVFRVVAFRWTLEIGSYDFKMVEIFLTLAYVGFLLTWTFVGSKDLEVTVLDVSHWSSRAGLVAASQFPLVTILGTKHNVISLITGIGYEKLNFFHRVTARSCFGLLLIHAGSKIYSAERVLKLFIQQSWLRFGATALSSLLILVVVSLRPIRTRVYEVFFYTHAIAVFVFLLGAYFHTGATHTTYWIWPCFMFWGLDRFMRFARLVVFNHLYCGFSRNARLQDATTELLSDDFVRVRVRRPPHFQWSAGQSAYLIMPSVSKFPLEAHPFSISSIDSDLFSPGVGDGHAAHWKELIFVINTRGGFTKRLKEAAAQRRTVQLLIDGPYGNAPDVCAYDTSILIAGGSGITHTLPIFLDAVEAARNGTCLCRRVVFIWAVRDASHIQWISDALYRANALKPNWLMVSIRIFVTRIGSGGHGQGLPMLTGLVESNSAETDGEPKKEALQNAYRVQDSDQDHEWIVPPCVRVESGRPDFKSILRGEVNTATGSLSVTVCGSQSLTRSVRGALRFPVSGLHSVMSGGPSVTLHVESFGYA